MAAPTIGKRLFINTICFYEAAPVALAPRLAYHLQLPGQLPDRNVGSVALLPDVALQPEGVADGYRPVLGRIRFEVGPADRGKVYLPFGRDEPGRVAVLAGLYFGYFPGNVIVAHKIFMAQR